MRSVPAAASNATRSVKVPPTSTPTRNALPFAEIVVCSPASVGIESHPMKRMIAVATLLFVSLCVASPACNSPAQHVPTKSTAATTTATIDTRKALGYLASDELEGRGPGTAGLDRA